MNASSDKNDRPDQNVPEDSPAGRPDEPVSFTLDGRPLTAPSADSTADEVLRLGGLDPAGYDLTQVRPGQAPDKPYADDRKIRIRNGDAFLSVRQSAQVA